MLARELLPGLQVRTVSVPVRCVPPSYNAHSCVPPALSRAPRWEMLPGRGARAAARTARAVAGGAWMGAGGLARFLGWETPNLSRCSTVLPLAGLRAAFPETLGVLPYVVRISWSYVVRRLPHQ